MSDHGQQRQQQRIGKTWASRAWLAGNESADGVTHVVDGLVDAPVHDLLLEGAEEALNQPVRRAACGDAGGEACAFSARTP
jgi:hypothetical protein